MSKNVSGEIGHRAGTTDATAAPACCLVVFSKSARPGRVKTRLIGELTAEQAADLHAAFLDDLVHEMLSGCFAMRVAWALEPGESLPACRVESMVQSGSDLGQRLYGALADLATDFPLVAAVGSDHPDLGVSLVHQAFDKLAGGADVVLGPAGDGGYYLVAVRREALEPALFDDIPWSSAAVLRITLNKCQRLNLNVDLLPIVTDVDTPEDLSRLITNLARDPGMGGPRTRALLRSWRRLPQSGSRGGNNENP